MVGGNGGGAAGGETGEVRLEEGENQWRETLGGDGGGGVFVL